MSDIVYGYPTASTLNSFDTVTLIGQLHALGFDDARNDGVGNVIVIKNRVGDNARAIILALAPVGRTLQICSNGRVLYEAWLRDERALREAIANVVETEKAYLRALRAEYVQ